MYAGKLVFAQVMEHLPLHTFRRIVSRYAGEWKSLYRDELAFDNPKAQSLMPA
jgi:Domain of unknown function (DUF4372)